MKISAEATVEIGGGLAYGSGPRGTFTIPTEMVFKDKFCSMHPGTEIKYIKEWDESYGQEKNIENWSCTDCDKRLEKRFTELLEEGKIDCVINLNHGHECRCNLGHDCDVDDCTVQEQLDQEREKAKQAGEEINEMMVLGAEAPSKVMMGVFKRLTDLETENKALKNSLAGLIELLSEETREALGCTEVLLRAEGCAEGHES